MTANIGQRKAGPLATKRSQRVVARVRELVESNAKLRDLVQLWESRDVEDWAGSREAFELLADRFLRMAEPLLAYDVAQEGLKGDPRGVRLRQQLALALTRSGATRSVRPVLRALYEEGHRDEETIGLLASTYKDTSDGGPTGEEKPGLQHARELYAEAHRLTHGYWSGINAATAALVMGDHANAQEVARGVRKTCREELKRLEKDGGDRYWVVATLGEAALILGEWAEARDWYSRAAEIAGKRYGDLQTSRRNARLLIAEMGGDRGGIEGCFHIPAVVLFAGHMIDQPGRKTPRFPAELEAEVKDRLRGRLKALEVGFGFSSAACGSDILFLEAMLEVGGEVRIVLPYEKAAFVQDSVRVAPGGNWEKRFESVLSRAASVSVSSHHRVAGGTIEYEYSDLVLMGVASLFAKRLDTKLVPLAVWNGEAGDGPGGTAWSVETWKNSGVCVEIVSLGAKDERVSVGSDARECGVALPGQAASEPAFAFAPEIRALLFADAVGFSKLTESEVHLFVQHFLGLIGKILEKSPHAPLVKNTWGDGLYFVFKNAGDAGKLALELCERIAGTDWESKGLGSLSLRIGLHAGPVYGCVDPVTGQRSYIGAHVSRAARMEPVTPPGQVYASEAFAALAAVERTKEFSCEYVGRVSLAKGYGVFSTYLVQRDSPRA
jgi:class 3 adenylate cyclase